MAGHIPQSSAAVGGPDRVTVYAWLVFALSFGLLISDYMARQVLNAVFPLLKAEWSLSDAQLGLLSGIVAIMVGVLTFPLSLAADRWGRVGQRGTAKRADPALSDNDRVKHAQHQPGDADCRKGRPPAVARGNCTADCDAKDLAERAARHEGRR